MPRTRGSGLLLAALLIVQRVSAQPVDVVEVIGQTPLGLDGSETFAVADQDAPLEAGQDVVVTITRVDGSSEDVVTTCRLDTANEVQYYLSGGILNFVLRNLI